MKDLYRGCIVSMKASSGMGGYGNLQCVSSYCKELGEVGFFGHNELYKDYHIAFIVERSEEKGEEKPSVSPNPTKAEIALSLKSILKNCDKLPTWVRASISESVEQLSALC